MAPATWHGTRSLATECYEAAGGDFEIALLLAVDYLHKFGGLGPQAQEAAIQQSSLDTHASAQALLQAAPPSSLTDREAA